LSAPSLMLLSCINGPDDRAQIYGGQIIPDPPDRSTFNGGGGGGGSGIADKTRAHLDDPGSSAQIYDQHWILDPPVHSAFNGGGGGPECVINNVHRSAAQRQVHRSTAQDVFRTPPTDLPLTEGGGSGMVLFLWRVPCYTWQRSNGPESHHLLLSDRPRHLWTSPSTFPEMVMSHNCCQSFPPIRSWQAPYYDFYLQSIAATSPVCIPQPPSPAISPSK
jgi:hypothetical protein